MLNDYISLLIKTKATYHANKKVEFDLLENNPFAIYIIRPLSIYLTPFFVKFDISANVVTTTGFIFAIIASLLLCTGQFSFMQWGGWLYLLNNLFDYIDGNVARFYGKTNHFGKFIDGTFGAITDTIVFFTLGIGVFYQISAAEIHTFWPISDAYIFIILGSMAACSNVLNSYLQIRFSRAQADADLARNEPNNSEKSPETVAILADNQRESILHAFLRLGWHSAEIILKYLTWFARLFKVPGLVLAIYLNSADLYLIFYAFYFLYDVVWEYIKMLYLGRQVLNVFRPY